MMRSTKLMSFRRRPWLSWLHATLLALLLIGQILPVGQAGAAAPPGWQLAAICHAAGGDDPAPGAPADQRHDHCAMCLASGAPIVLANTVVLPMPVGFVQAAPWVKISFALPLLARCAHAPRAPPGIV